MSPYPCFNTRLFWHKFSILQYIRVSYHGYFTRSVYQNTANQIFPWFIHGDFSWSLYWNTEIFQQFWQLSWFIHGNFFKIRDPKHADSIKVVSCICTISVVHTRKFFQDPWSETRRCHKSCFLYLYNIRGSYTEIFSKRNISVFLNTVMVPYPCFYTRMWCDWSVKKRNISVFLNTVMVP